jgi:hypothetical protein
VVSVRDAQPADQSPPTASVEVLAALSSGLRMRYTSRGDVYLQGLLHIMNWLGEAATAQAGAEILIRYRVKKTDHLIARV